MPSENVDVKVTALHLHPIKGCHRIEVDEATITSYGLAGDREWQLVAADGAFMTQRKHPQLARVQPALLEGGIRVSADGRRDLEVATPTVADTTAPTYSGDVQVGDAGDDAAAWFTELLGEPVRLVGIAPGYDRRFPFSEAGTNLGDVAPLLLVNRASYDFLAERAVEPFPIERFRPNLVVDHFEPWAEETWKTLRIGDAKVRCLMPWPRCAVPQVDQETGKRHKEPALVLKQERWCDAVEDGADQLAVMMLPNTPIFGMACIAEPAGATIRVGDSVMILANQPRVVPLAATEAVRRRRR
jgi:uncharacterized protein YcbX